MIESIAFERLEMNLASLGSELDRPQWRVEHDRAMRCRSLEDGLVKLSGTMEESITTMGALLDRSWDSPPERWPDEWAKIADMCSDYYVIHEFLKTRIAEVKADGFEIEGLDRSERLLSEFHGKLVSIMARLLSRQIRPSRPIEPQPMQDAHVEIDLGESAVFDLPRQGPGRLVSPQRVSSRPTDPPITWREFP